MYSLDKITRTISLIGVSALAISVSIALAIPAQLSAQTPLSAPTMIIFDVPGSASTSPASINPTGAITGSDLDANGGHGFVRDSDGNITTFDPAGSYYT